MQIREDWLAQVREEIVDPERPIVDPHHHFFLGSEMFPDYMLGDLWKDTGSGHHVEQTVFLQCGMHYRESGPESMAPVGETEWVAGIAAEAAKGRKGAARIGAIAGHADLCLGAAVREVLEAHLQASPLFCGIRDIAIWDADPEVHSVPKASDAALYRDPKFREGFAQLEPLGLSFDAYHYHTQTPYLTELARAFPGTTIVLDHLGTPVGVASYAGKREEIFAQWKRDLTELATCPNVVIKLGGMLMPWNGYGWELRERPATSDELVQVQGRYYRHAIEAFGPERCMFESNFPVDKLSCSYTVLWNQFKKLTRGFSADERKAMFHDTAMRTYRLPSH